MVQQTIDAERTEGTGRTQPTAGRRVGDVGAVPFCEISPWVETPRDLQPSLVDDLSADVVVLGGGYTGLSTALALRSQGADVVLLETAFAGSGASGRNAGHLTPTIGKDIPTLLRWFGRDRARDLVRFADAAVEETEETIRKLAIDCEYAPVGNVLAGVHPGHESRLRRAAEAAAELGAQVRFLDEGAMRERGLPPAFVTGILEERGGHLHPGRYALGLREAALAAGVRLFEQSECVELTDAPRVVARTAHGQVVADAAVLATNAYTASLGWLRRRVVPLHVSLLETDPLDDDRLASLGWRGREGVYTSHEILESYHVTARNTLVGGSRVVRAGFGNRLPPARDPASLRAIERAFRERFPSLRDVPIARFWGGWIGFTTDFLPLVGTTGRHRNVVYGIGFGGHGVAQGTLMGPILAERVQGRQHPWERALDRRTFAWPPEPLRWLGGRLLIGVLEALDRRTDRRIRSAGDRTRPPIP